MRTLLLTLVSLTFTAVFPAHAQEAPKLRLPDNAKPLRYRLDLRLVPEEDGFKGLTQIDIDVTKDTDVLWLNSTGLQVSSASIGSGAKAEKARVVDGGKEFIGLALDHPIKRGATTVSIEYVGKLNKTDVEGLFKQQEGKDFYILTQFEPTSARFAFPSFDEPGFKTPFTVTMRVPKQYGAFTNTPSVSESEADGLKVVRFAESKPLPTYLVAFAVGPFDVVDGGLVGRKKVRHRVIVPRGRAADVKYVVSVTPRIVAALEDYFGLPYPYEKLDQITIPITVGFGAMENAGLITYQQSILLARAGEDTPQWKRASTSTITHEISHQWFGNMVTPAWWDDIWLNEAFATWMARRTNDGLFPDWKNKVQGVVAKHAVMGQDSLITARKIRQPIENEGDIGRAFDGITYQKGGAVIRMFENYVGEDQFRKGVQQYMKKHAWGHATATDFVDAISQSSGKNVRAAFSSFLDRTGVPLLTVSLSCSPNAKPELEVTQQRSLPLGSKGDRSVYWQVPVCLTYQNGKAVARQCSVIADPKDKIQLQAANACPDWVYVGENGTGYYRVRYSDDLQAKIATAAAKLSVQEQVDLLKNTWALVASGNLPAEVVLAMLPEAARSPERELVIAAIGVVEGLERSVPPELAGKYRDFASSLFSERARSLGWHQKPGESEDDRILRAAVLDVAGVVADDPVISKEAVALAESWLKTRTGLSADMVPLALRLAARQGDRALFDRYVAAARSTADRKERGYIRLGLGGFRDPAIASDALKLTLDPQLDVREYTFLLTAFQGDARTERVAWDFMKQNYSALLPRLPMVLGTGGGTTLVNSGLFFCNAEGRKEVSDFFDAKVDSFSGGRRGLENALERIELCAPQRAAFSQGITKYFAAK